GTRGQKRPRRDKGARPPLAGGIAIRGPDDWFSEILLVALVVSRERDLRHEGFRARSRRSPADHPDAIPPLRGECPRVPCGVPTHRRHGANRRLLRVDDLVAYHGGFPRRRLLGGGPRGGPRCPRGDMGEGPDRGPRDLAIHYAHARRHAGPLRQLPLLEPDPERPSRGLVLARDLRRRAGRHARDWTFATPRTRRRSAARAPRPGVDANPGARPRRRHAR